MKLEDRNVNVMLILTRLRHGSERTIMEQLRRNCMGLKSRRVLQRCLCALIAEGVVRHDNRSLEYVLDDARAQRWCKDLEFVLSQQQSKVGEIKMKLSMVQDHLLMGGSPLYSWVSIKRK